ncbi:MAG: hypothetical protein ACHQKY_17380 [Terriglobia bacterium]
MARRINWRIVLSNLAEAREELQRLEALVVDRRRRHEALLEVGLGHAYHHLNCAWRARAIPTSRYARCTTRDFNLWGRFPTNVWLPRLEPGASAAVDNGAPVGRTRNRKKRLIK